MVFLITPARAEETQTTSSSLSMGLNQSPSTGMHNAIGTWQGLRFWFADFDNGNIIISMYLHEAWHTDQFHQLFRLCGVLFDQVAKRGLDVDLLSSWQAVIHQQGRWELIGAVAVESVGKVGKQFLDAQTRRRAHFQDVAQKFARMPALLL